MTTNELMRQLLADIPEDDQRHLVEVVDRNHAEQLARKRRAPREPHVEDLDHAAEGHDNLGADDWDDDTV